MKSVLLLVCAAGLFAAPPAKKQVAEVETPTVAAKTPALARIIQYGARDVVKLHARPLYVTKIILPEKERIAEVEAGDKEFWDVVKGLNTAAVKPTQNKSETNLHLTTVAGNTYSFLLISNDALETDFKVFLEPKEESMISALNGPPKLVEASVVAGLKEEVEQWRLEAYRRGKEKDAAVAEAKAQAAARAPADIKHEYKFDANKRPFNLKAMWHDGRFTYLAADPEELPSLYEEKDGKPNMVPVRFENGVYTVDKVMENGWLQLGKKKTEFSRVR